MAGTRVSQGHCGSGEAAGSLGANLLVSLDTSGLVKLCASAEKPIGSVQLAWSTGETVTYYRPTGTHALIVSAAVAKGDYIQCSGAGKVACSGSTGATTATVSTCGIARTAGTTDGDIIDVEFV